MCGQRSRPRSGEVARASTRRGWSAWCWRRAPVGVPLSRADPARLARSSASAPVTERRPGGRGNKSDAHDAEGLAQLARTGWFKKVHIKDSATHLDRARLKVRGQLIRAHRAMANQLRGLLKLFGLRLGKVTTPAQARPAAGGAAGPKAGVAAGPGAARGRPGGSGRADRASSRGLKARAEADPVAARLMSVPGVGPITALTFTASIEDPGRFARSADAGAYAGLVPRRFQSGERDTRGTSPRPATRCCAGALRGRQQPPGPGQAALRPAALGQGAGPGQGRQARPRRRRPQARHPPLIGSGGPSASFQWA